MRRFPYAIYFVVLPESILVIAVLHVRGIPKSGSAECNLPPLAALSGA